MHLRQFELKTAVYLETADDIGKYYVLDANMKHI